MVLFIAPFFSTSVITTPVRSSALAEYEVRFTFTGYIPSNGGSENCIVNEKGNATLMGILKGYENTGDDDPVLYTGTLQINFTIDICSIRRLANGEDKFCTMTVSGSGPVNTELELDPAAGYGYIKINYDPALGKFTRSVSGDCDQLQMTDEEKMIPNDTEAAIFNGRELPMLTEKTLRKKQYPADKGADGETVVEVIRKIQ